MEGHADGGHDKEDCYGYISAKLTVSAHYLTYEGAIAQGRLKIGGLHTVKLTNTIIIIDVHYKYEIYRCSLAQTIDSQLLTWFFGDL